MASSMSKAWEEAMINQGIDECRRDDAFQTRLRHRLEADREVLERLAQAQKPEGKDKGNPNTEA